MPNSTPPDSNPPPFTKGVIIWIYERVPPPILVGSVLMYLACQKFGQYVYSSHVRMSWYDVLGGLSMCCYLLLIRSLDEHKDFEEDSANYPDRPVQRGIITLNQIKFVGGCSLLIMLGDSLLIDGSWGKVCWLWLLSIFWLFLMTKEFFVETWLRNHIIVYGVSHQFLTPLMVLWLVQMGTGNQWIEIARIWPILFFVCCASLMFELTRKTWGKEEEREGVDSYSEALGVWGAVGVNLLLLLLLTASLFYIFAVITQKHFSYFSAFAGGSAFLAACMLLKFGKNPTRKGRKQNEAAVGLASLVGYVAILIALFK